ncbi:MAG: molybdopterin-dependent oxidoreductase [Candidatus Sulfotelmatobacter sp.]
MKFKGLLRDISGGLFVTSMVTAALVGIFFGGWKIAGLPFVPFDAFDWLTRVLPGRVLGFGIGIMVHAIRSLHLGPTSETAKTVEHAIAITGLFVMGIVGEAILFSILRTRRKVHPVFLGLVLGIVVAAPAMLISTQASDTATVDPWLRAVWILVAFAAWGAILGRVAQRMIGIETPNSTVERATEPRVERIDRRHFLVKLGGSAAAITVVGALVGEFADTRRKESAMMAASEPLRWSATHPLPNAAAAVKPAPGTRPEFTSLESHYRIDINAIPPKVDEQRWRLKTSGLVEQPLSLTLEQLRDYEPLHQFVTLSCISNPVGGDLIGTTRWTGVSLQRLLPDLRLQPTATHLKIRSADEFFEVVALDAIKADERIMLTYAWDGVPLRREHGFPLRIYIPDVHGMKQPKWIESIEFTDHWEPGFWVVRGWNKVAQMHATSVIDTVAVDMTIIGADKRKLVPIGGMAHAGDRGISKIEVQVDNGPWEQALIRTPLSQLTWVVWRHEWPFRPGKHTFSVRCYDGNGTLQIAAPSPPEPDGATGLSSRSVML